MISKPRSSIAQIAQVRPELLLESERPFRRTLRRGRSSGRVRNDFVIVGTFRGRFIFVGVLFLGRVSTFLDVFDARYGCRFANDRRFSGGDCIIGVFRFYLRRGLLRNFFGSRHHQRVDEIRLCRVWWSALSSQLVRIPSGSLAVGERMFVSVKPRSPWSSLGLQGVLGQAQHCS